MANTIQDKLAYLEGTKDAIKQAIIAKGVSVSDSDTFRSYADKITSIQTGGGTTFTEGIKFGYSKFTTVPSEIFPYLETQNDMYMIFGNCTSLQTVPSFNTSNVTNMNYMFNNCSSLKTVHQFNTANVTDMNHMFGYCTSLQTVPLFNTSNVTNMNNMFLGCSSLKTVPQFNTANVTNMSAMFWNCTSLQTVPLFNTSNVTDMSNIFLGCKSLTNLGGFTVLSVSLNLKYSLLLTVDSVMNIINEAADMSASPQTLTLHADVFSQLSNEQIETANAKGWNIASA